MRVSAVILSLILLAVLITAGCSSSAVVVREPRLVPQTVAASTQAINREERSETRQSYVGIYEFGGDDWTESWRPRVPAPPAIQMREENGRASTEAPSDTVRIREMRGYRVQLANVTTEQEARRIERRAKPLFDEVYIVFQSPSYKIRGGNFQRRANADAAASEARRMGFHGAWVVPDRIEVREGGPAQPSASVGANGASR